MSIKDDILDICDDIKRSKVAKRLFLVLAIVVVSTILGVEPKKLVDGFVDLMGLAAEVEDSAPSAVTE